MELNINVKHATLDDVFTIFYRLGDTTVTDAWESEKVELLQGFLDEGCNLNQALEKLEEELHKRVEVIEKKEIQKEKKAKKESGTKKETKKNSLHLDGAPQKDEVTKVTHQDIANLASELARSGKSKILKEILKEFNADKILDIEESRLPEVLEKMKAA